MVRKIRKNLLDNLLRSYNDDITRIVKSADSNHQFLSKKNFKPLKFFTHNLDRSLSNPTSYEYQFSLLRSFDSSFSHKFHTEKNLDSKDSKFNTIGYDETRRKEELDQDSLENQFNTINEGMVLNFFEYATNDCLVFKLTNEKKALLNNCKFPLEQHSCFICDDKPMAKFQNTKLVKFDCCGL